MRREGDGDASRRGAARLGSAASGSPSPTSCSSARCPQVRAASLRFAEHSPPPRRAARRRADTPVQHGDSTRLDSAHSNELHARSAVWRSAPISAPRQPHNQYLDRDRFDCEKRAEEKRVAGYLRLQAASRLQNARFIDRRQPLLLHLRRTALRRLRIAWRGDSTAGLDSTKQHCGAERSTLEQRESLEQKVRSQAEGKREGRKLQFQLRLQLQLRRESKFRHS